jgi:hypothetical protein
MLEYSHFDSTIHLLHCDWITRAPGDGERYVKKRFLPVEAGMPSDERSELMIDQP